jgi:hypothetical protein
MNARHVTIAVAAAILALAAAGCAGKSNKDLLPGAVYAANVFQVYKGAELTGMMGNDTYGDTPESHMQGQFWTFTVKDSKEKVLAFYEQQFPNAERTTLDDGAIQLRIVPEGAEANEDVYVTIREGEIMIGEHCKPGKIPES